MSVERTSSALAALLEEERAALLAGDFDRLASLAERKESLAAGLETLADAEALAGLRDRLERNAALLDGAAAGVRSVAERLAAMREVRDALSTYDADGRRRDARHGTAPRLERRA